MGQTDSVLRDYKRKGEKNMKSKIIFLLTIVFMAVIGACMGEFLSTADLPFISWLGFHSSFGFDEFSLNLVFFQMSLSLKFDLYIIQGLLMLIGIKIAAKLNNAVKF